MGNEEMTRYLLENGWIDERIARALKALPREKFVPEEYKNYSYADQPLPIGWGQTISAPSIVGMMTKHLDLEKGMKVLEVGSGSGWQALILAELVGEKGEIYSIERIRELMQMAKEKAEKFGYKNIKFILGDGTLGYKEAAPYDRIIVTAAAPKLPQPLLDQLKEGGKMVIPVGPPFWQTLVLVRKNKEIKQEGLLPVMFVPLIGVYGYKE